MITLIIILAFVFIIGLCIGSFLNVVILRGLSGESIVFPASKCPKCQNPLKWWHNIPVISYICLRGKCAFCKEPISIQYPITELFTGIIFTLIFIKFGFAVQTLLFWAYAAVLVAIAGTDIREKIVFDIHTYTLVGLGLLFSLGNLIYFLHLGAPLTWVNNPLTISILGIIVGVVIMEAFARAGYLVAGTRAFGEGDTFIAAGLGALFGWKILLIILALSVVIQVILFLPIFLKGLVCDKEWKTLASFLTFVVYAGSFYTLQQIGVIKVENAILYLILTIILALIGLFTCVQIFKGLRENPQSRTYMPFGPAMVAAAFIAMILL